MWTFSVCYDLDIDIDIDIDLFFSFLADGHLQKLLLTACRDDAVVVDVVGVEVVAGGHLQIFKFFVRSGKFSQVG